jgi:hypothetical protein
MGVCTIIGQCFVGPLSITSVAFSPLESFKTTVARRFIESSSEITKLDTRLQDMWPPLERIETAVELNDRRWTQYRANQNQP